MHVRVRVRVSVCVDLLLLTAFHWETGHQTAYVLMVLIDLLIYVSVTSWFIMSLCKPAGFGTGGGGLGGCR